MAFVPSPKKKAGAIGFRNGSTTLTAPSTVNEIAFRLGGASRGSVASPLVLMATMGGVWRWWARAGDATSASRRADTRAWRTARPYHAAGRDHHDKCVE